MVDFRVDDGFGSHPKTVGMSDAAVVVWLLGGCWSVRYLTDGRVPGQVLANIAGRRRRAIPELVERGLIEPVDGGDWQYVDWMQYQRSRNQIQSEREATRKRLAKWREDRKP